MRAIAKAEDKSRYEKALQCFRDSAAWRNNVKLQKYFQNVWLVEKEVDNKLKEKNFLLINHN